MKKIILKYKKYCALTLLLIIAGTMVSLQRCYSQNNTPGTPNIAVKDTIGLNIKEPKLCGNYKIDSEVLRKVKDFESLKGNRLLDNNRYLIRVYFHICANDDGTNPGATAANLTSEFNTLVADYAPYNICFLNAGFNFVNNTKLNMNFNINTDDFSLFNPYCISKCINIFYPQQISGSNSACNSCGVGGVTPTLPSTFCLVSNGNIGQGQSISHEVGHCFGLQHTFGAPGSDFEDINGSNSASAGDGITDTPADPFAFKQSGAACFQTASCIYTGTCTDPNGQKNFSPPYNNLMAYWWAKAVNNPCYSNLALTPGQFSRINTYLSTSSDLEACESPLNVTFGPVTYTSGYQMFSAINTLTTNGAVNLSGSTVTTLGGSLVLAEPGFDATSSAGALILLRPSVCAPAGNRNELQTGSESIPAITTIITGSSNDLKCYPNPFSQKFTVEFNMQKDDEASIKLYDFEGRQLKTILKSFYTKGIHLVTVDASGFPAGIYILVMQTSDSRKQQKVIKIG